MTDPDERSINRVIALVSNDWQDEREEARAALHRLFNDRRRLERELAKHGPGKCMEYDRYYGGEVWLPMEDDDG